MKKRLTVQFNVHLSLAKVCLLSTGVLNRTVVLLDVIVLRVILGTVAEYVCLLKNAITVRVLLKYYTDLYTHTNRQASLF